MSLSTWLVAVEGVSLSPITLAVHGLIQAIREEFKWDTSQGKAPSNIPDHKAYVERLNREYNRLLKDDETAVDLIVALVTQGFFDGYA